MVDNKKLVTGDTLFVEAIGRVDLAGGDAEKMFNSLQKLKKLNENILEKSELVRNKYLGLKSFKCLKDLVK